MSSNQGYKTRSSTQYYGGNFVAGSESQQPQQPQTNFNITPVQTSGNLNYPQADSYNVEFTTDNGFQSTDVEMDRAPAQSDKPKPAWMKSKLEGVKKTTNKERRRRQNLHLRKLISPKQAVMALTEMMPGRNIANSFNVYPVQNLNINNFCAELDIDGCQYKGFGESKMSARNAAAEQAIRQMVVKQLNNTTGEGESKEEGHLPMIQVASFALYKLFNEWQHDGFNVSLSKGPAQSKSPKHPPRTPQPPGSKAPRVLPLNASALHPCSLLSYMRSDAVYRELDASGDRPQAMTFTIGVDVDGQTYAGSAGSKKDAKKSAALLACTAIFGVQFDPQPSASSPVVADKQPAQQV